MLRTGIDLIEISRFEDMNPEIRQHFLERVFTPAELAYCGDRANHLAGRFAAKEAVSKALGSGIGSVAWQEIEVLSAPNGEPDLHLHGEADRLARELGLTEWSLSITHDRSTAAAVAVAVGPGKENAL